MDNNLNVLGDFLVENYQDEEIVQALKESNDDQSKKLISYVKDTLLLETTLKQIQDISVALDVKRDNVIYTKKQELEKKIENGSFNYKDALDFASEVSVIANRKKEVKDSSGNPVIDPETNTQKFKNVEKLLRDNIRVIEKMQEPRRTQMAKMFAFQLISTLNKRAEKKAKEPEGQTRTIISQTGKAIVQPTKGKNDSTSVRHEVQRIVKTEGNTVSRELERMDEMMKDERSARIYCDMLFKSFMQQYEGTGKQAQFSKELSGLMSRKVQIEKAIKLKSEEGSTQEEKKDWNNLNTFTIMKDIKEYAEGKSSLSLSQIKGAVKSLKKSNFDALELADRALGGKEDKAISRDGQTKARSGQ